MLVCTIIYFHVHVCIYIYACTCLCIVCVDVKFLCMLLMHVINACVWTYCKWMSTPECSCTYLYACSSMAICVYVCKLQGCVVCALVLLDRRNPRRRQWPVTGPSGSPSCSWCWPLWQRSLLGITPPSPPSLDHSRTTNCLETHSHTSHTRAHVYRDAYYKTPAKAYGWDWGLGRVHAHTVGALLCRNTSSILNSLFTKTCLRLPGGRAWSLVLKLATASSQER